MSKFYPLSLLKSLGLLGTMIWAPTLHARSA